MKFTMKQPCDSCPFVRAHRFYLHSDRVQEIEDHVDGGFSCHQTVDYDSFDDHEDPEGDCRDRAKEVHCLGHLILQWNEWNGFGNMAAFAARLGEFSPEELPTSEQAGVFESWDEMREFMDELHG